MPRRKRKNHDSIGFLTKWSSRILLKVPNDNWQAMMRLKSLPIVGVGGMQLLCEEQRF